MLYFLGENVEMESIRGGSEAEGHKLVWNFVNRQFAGRSPLATYRNEATVCVP